MRRTAVLWGAVLSGIVTGCAAVPTKIGAGPLEVSVVAGSQWRHRHPIFLFFSIMTPPQLAIWIESPEGSYVTTAYVTKKAATQGWLPTPGEKVPPQGIRRPESLPVWSHHRGVRYDDGLYMPTKGSAMTDATSGASFKGNFTAALDTAPGLRKFRVLAEVNVSIDFNEAYPASARPGDPGYSGGKLGSGQPSLVYAADVDLDSGVREWRFALIGRGSPDGTDGSINPDVSGLTTALNMVDSITASLK
jgi:hypothetical protein